MPTLKIDKLVLDRRAVVEISQKGELQSDIADVTVGPGANLSVTRTLSTDRVGSVQMSVDGLKFLGEADNRARIQVATLAAGSHSAKAHALINLERVSGKFGEISVSLGDRTDGNVALSGESLPVATSAEVGVGDVGLTSTEVHLSAEAGSYGTFDGPREEPPAGTPFEYEVASERGVWSGTEEPIA